MLHKLVQIDSGHWQVDDCEITKETGSWVTLSGFVETLSYYIGRDSNGNQVTDTHTTFEDCLGELIAYTENKDNDPILEALDVD